MEVLHPHCCGLDVHKDTVVACVRLVIDGKTVKEVRTFSTTTADLMALSQWLAENKCTMGISVFFRDCGPLSPT